MILAGLFRLIFGTFVTCMLALPFLFPYTGVYYTFGLLDFIQYNHEDFVISKFVAARLCYIHFTVTLAGLDNIVRETEVTLYF